MINVTDKQDLEKILISNQIVVVDFFAEWCGPCQALLPIIRSIAEKMKDKVTMVKINIDQASSLARQYNIRSVPTILLFKNNNLLNRLVGFRDESELVLELNKLFIK